MASSNIFHLSTVVEDLKVIQQFYCDILGYRITKDEGDWVNIDFHGHQLTFNQSTPDSKSQKIDHFGVVVGAKEWISLVKKARVRLLKSQYRESSTTQYSKFLVFDPCGNIIEYKTSV